MFGISPSCVKDDEVNFSVMAVLCVLSHEPRATALMFSHQPTVAMAATTASIIIQTSTGADGALGPIFSVRPPGNSAVAGHPVAVEPKTHDRMLNGAGVSTATAHAAGVRTRFFDDFDRHENL